MKTEVGGVASTFSTDTFLTSLRDGGANTDHSGMQKIVIQEPASMVEVRSRYDQLNEAVGSLSEQIGAVLSKQEEDFLAAYRAHMYNVQKELHELRKKLQLSEASEQKSEKIKIMESERNWYRKEALRLDAFAISIKNDLKDVKEKLHSIEEDRDWLETQLKGSKKQNKLLRAELEIRLRQPTEKHANEALAVVESTTSEAEANAAALLEEREQYYRKQIRNLKREVQSGQKELISLRSEILSRNQKSPMLEEFFVKSIDAVKKDIFRRKRDANKRKDKINGGGTKAPELGDFASSDRVQVIEKLLSHDEVLSFLYDHLFPAEEEERNDTAVAAPVVPTPVPETTEKEIISESYPVGSGASAAASSRGVSLNDSTLEYLRQR